MSADRNKKITGDVTTEDSEAVVASELVDGQLADDALAHDALAHDALAHDALAHDALAHDALAHDALTDGELSDEALAEADVSGDGSGSDERNNSSEDDSDEANDDDSDDESSHEEIEEDMFSDIAMDVVYDEDLLQIDAPEQSNQADFVQDDRSQDDFVQVDAANLDSAPTSDYFDEAVALGSDEIADLNDSVVRIENEDAAFYDQAADVVAPHARAASTDADNTPAVSADSTNTDSVGGSANAEFSKSSKSSESSESANDDESITHRKNVLRAAREDVIIDSVLNRTQVSVQLAQYPTLSFDHVTVSNVRTHRTVIDDLSVAFDAGHSYEILGDEEQRLAVLALIGHFINPDRGQVLLKSTDINQLDNSEIRGHRIAFVGTPYDLRDDLDPIEALLYAMDASGRTFLKPKPVIARELLTRVGFKGVAVGTPVAKLSAFERRQIAIARAWSCEPHIVVFNEPVAGFEGEEAEAIVQIIRKIVRKADPKVAVLVMSDAAKPLNCFEATLDLSE